MLALRTPEVLLDVFTRDVAVVVDEVRGVEEFVRVAGGGRVGFDDCTWDDTYESIRPLNHLSSLALLPILHLHIPHSFAKSRYFLRYVSH